MKTVELFSGTKSFSKVMAAHGHETLTVDSDPRVYPDINIDMLWFDHLSLSEIDILWASPPCEGFSVAAIGKNWNYDNTPKTETARLAMKLASHTLKIIEEIKPRYWFIENPRGKLRKMPFMRNLTRHTISYCQYGDERMKPTDIWTNAIWWKPRPICKNGDKCHVSAPRGSSTGTQGIKGAKNRGIIPPKLFEEILNQMPYASKP